MSTTAPPVGILYVTDSEDCCLDADGNPHTYGKETDFCCNGAVYAYEDAEKCCGLEPLPYGDEWVCCAGKALDKSKTQHAVNVDIGPLLGVLQSTAQFANKLPNVDVQAGNCNAEISLEHEWWDDCCSDRKSILYKFTGSGYSCNAFDLTAYGPLPAFPGVGVTASMALTVAVGEIVIEKTCEETKGCFQFTGEGTIAGGVYAGKPKYATIEGTLEGKCKAEMRVCYDGEEFKHEESDGLECELWVKARACVYDVFECELINHQIL
jgi:hypothetical protein